MNLEEIQQLQPELVERFTQILEHKQLSHAYLFTGSFASFEMALLLAQISFAKICRESGLVANAGPVA